jgi:3-deoxy-D-manno-octulosonic-acid transferase
MLRALYTAALHLALPYVPLRLWWRGRKEPGYRQHVGERFGRYDVRPPQPLIWIHAVSLGETRAAQPLVEALRKRFPDHALLVTHMTATGREAATNLYGGFATLAFLPYDLPWAGAAIQVADADALVREAARLLGDAGARKRMGDAGRRFCEAHRGATGRTMAIVERLLGAGSSAEAR